MVPLEYKIGMRHFWAFSTWCLYLLWCVLLSSWLPGQVFEAMNFIRLNNVGIVGISSTFNIIHISCFFAGTTISTTYVIFDILIIPALYLSSVSALTLIYAIFTIYVIPAISDISLISIFSFNSTIPDICVLSNLNIVFTWQATQG